MIRLNAMDIISIQDCLSGYERLIKMIKPTDEVDLLLQDERLRIISHLQNKCEVLLRKEKERGECN